jgi:hypothetical protein
MTYSRSKSGNGMLVNLSSLLKESSSYLLSGFVGVALLDKFKK